MKAMPVTDLIQLLTEYKFGRGYGKTKVSIVTQDYIERLFETYGDDYYKESSYSPYELSELNQERIKRLNTNVNMTNLNVEYDMANHTDHSGMYISCTKKE